MDIARETGVSIATVSRVLHDNGYVAAQKKQEILEFAKQNGYAIAEKSLTDVQPLDTIGVISCVDRENIYFSHIMHYVAEEANKREMFAVPYTGEIDNKSLRDGIQKLCKQKVCGIIITGFSDPMMSESNSRMLRECDVPVVFIERTGGCFGVNRVLLNGQEGMYLATKHLISQGHQHIAYIGPLNDDDVDQDRLNGFQSAVLEHKEPLVVTEIVKICKETMFQSGYDFMKAALQRDPLITGVVAWSDNYAIGAMRYCSELQIKIPDDISITGFDGIIAPYTFPPLTGIEMPFTEMAKCAVDMILQNQDTTLDFYAKTIKLSPRLICRQSTKTI